MYLEPSKTSKFELYVKTAYDFQALTILTKSSILEVWLGTEYAPPPPCPLPYILRTIMVSETASLFHRIIS